MLSRIKERYQATGDNQQAVAQGLQASAKTISSAALIMVAVFAIFAGTGVPQIKEIGVGLAVAIVLDATVVRLVLVPTTMELMGDCNWWLPKWLDRRLPDMDFESSDPDRSTRRGTWQPHEQDRDRHRMLLRHRAGDRQAARRRAARPSTRPLAGPSRSPTSRPPAARRWRSTSRARSRCRPPSTVEEAEGASTRSSTTPASRRSARSRRVPMDRVRGAVRDQRLRPGAAHPARAAGDARGGRGPDRHRRLDERQASPGPARATTAAPSTRWRRSATRCATRCARSAIDVVLVEPGFVKTPLGKTAAGRRVEDDDGPYASYNAAVAEVATGSYTTGALGKLACTPRPWPRRSSKALTPTAASARYRVARSAGPVHDDCARCCRTSRFDAFLRSRMPRRSPRASA